MVVVALGLFVAPFQSGVVERGSITGLIGAEQINRDAKVKVQIALNGLQVNHAGLAQPPGVVGFQLIHYLAGSLNNPGDARLPDKHMMRLFGQHKFRRPGQRIKA